MAPKRPIKCRCAYFAPSARGVNGDQVFKAQLSCFAITGSDPDSW